MTRFAVKRGLPGLADTGFISVASFLTTILLARALAPAAFGAFALAYMFILAVNGAIAALTSQPHMVLSAGLQSPAYRRFTSYIAVVQVFLLLAVAGIGLGVAGIGHLLGWSATPLVLISIGALVAFRLQDSISSALWTEGRLIGALSNDVANYASQVAGLFLLYRLGILGTASALLVVAASSAIGIVLGGWQLRQSISRHADFGWIHETWSYGKWLVGAQVFEWLAIPSYSYLAGLIAGAAAAGTIRAAQLPFGPLNFIIGFLANLLPIRLSRTLAEDGSPSHRTGVKTAYLVTVPLFATYCLLVAAFAEPILHVLYGTRYMGAAGVVRIMAIYYFLHFLSQVGIAELKSLRATQFSFRAAVYAGITTVLVGWILVHMLGAAGAVLGMVVSLAVLNSGLLMASRHLHRGEAGLDANGFRARSAKRSKSILGLPFARLHTRAAETASAETAPEQEAALG